jgi:hypothetical protein
MGTAPSRDIEPASLVPVTAAEIEAAFAQLIHVRALPSAMG